MFIFLAKIASVKLLDPVVLMFTCRFTSCKLRCPLKLTTVLATTASVRFCFLA
jgi:hypothetical protein